MLQELNLKRGNVTLCGAPALQFGRAELQTSCSETTREQFNLALTLLHSFEYDEAEKAFSAVIDSTPNCAMAYWGVAMANFHPLWTPPTEDELRKGTRAVQVAKSLNTTTREAAYIEAIAAFYNNWETTSHSTRCLKFEQAMEAVYTAFPSDKEAAVFYALALTAAALPTDKSFTKQKKAGRILQALYPGQPNHPGIVHYLIHTYDYPELAALGLPAARKYAAIAPSSAHALHMPSHIFTRLGLWDECIKSNLASVSSAKCYAEATNMPGHWDEELHGLDYLTYAYLQKGANDSAQIQRDYVKSIKEVQPVTFKVAYAYAAIPARYALETRQWAAAANLPVAPSSFPWHKFPWQEAIVHYARLLGAARIKSLPNARVELAQLHRLQNMLLAQHDAYKANQVAIQLTSGEAWLRWAEGNNTAAVALMQRAADMEDQTEKHPVTPCEVLPARELLGDMLLQLHQPHEALVAYRANLRKHPNRFNALYGAGLAAKKLGDTQAAAFYFQQLLRVVGASNSPRPEVAASQQYVQAVAAL
ncbi:tetratricopeptide repeat protein [Hymenobacter wooponensis]|uniref:tetratricopeptide repeat protein n=1 Tax=Hymenobacter wooponensis TaxID=1525360 RepID=UPI001AEBF129|nr:tetratricopeptide repeat protein [Hymenobacter wooponensis]